MRTSPFPGVCVCSRLLQSLVSEFPHCIPHEIKNLNFSFFQLHSDIDSGDGNIKYILSGEGAGTIFVIDDKSGNIHATKTLDREERAQYTLMAQAVDRDTNRPLEPPSEFIVKVQDINDNPPEFLHETYHANVPERSNVGAYRRRGLLCFQAWCLCGGWAEARSSKSGGRASSVSFMAK